MIYTCCDDQRRAAVRDHGTLQGIDFLEVMPDQQRLELHFVPPSESLRGTKPTRPPALTPNNIRISGGERIPIIHVQSVDYPPVPENVVVVTVDDDDNPLNGVGDFSLYTLRLIRGPDDEGPPDSVDPRLSAVDFSFKVNCPSEFDCRTRFTCPPVVRPEPEIDYLAKDYASFRQLLLDRMALLVPNWRERNPADIGVALVDLLAYVGDYLSYQQDAVATEAYLGTARRRVSVRRHARLVDYHMHDGCNARVWLHIAVSAPVVLPLPSSNTQARTPIQFLTRVAGQPVAIPPDPTAYRDALTSGAEVFELLEETVSLFPEHNELTFYTWGARECCLPAGTTKATLLGHHPQLWREPAAPGGQGEGQALLLEEVVGPRSKLREDADPLHRHVVRLTKVQPTVDLLFTESDSRDPLRITNIEWHAEDALPFPLCISAITDKGEYLEKVSVARGNIVLADHGRTIQESLDPVPTPDPPRMRVSMKPWRHCDDAAERAADQQRLQIRPRFRPSLKNRPVTQAATVQLTTTMSGARRTTRAPFDPQASARAALQWSMEDVLPAVSLDPAGWQPVNDLLGQDRFSNAFVVETESDGTASLRFGDDHHGRRPPGGTTFQATYRVGNGARGNVGAESIAHIVTNQAGIVAVRNPLAAQGGIDPETSAQVRHRAPVAFRTQERAVTAADYALAAQRDPSVQRAAATFRWTGSWRTVFVTADRLGGAQVDAPFIERMRQRLERFRMAGYDLEINRPQFVPLEVELHVCVHPDYFRSVVKTALLDLFSARFLPDGRLGLFHPDRFSFGQPVYLSPLYAAAQAVPGVMSVHITTFQRWGTESREALDRGYLSLGRLEIARLDNDRNFPERGVLRVTAGGGK